MKVTDEDIYEYLEHFGVRGMHWGVRSAPPARIGTGTKTKTPEDRKKTLKKVAIGAGAVGAGAIIAGVLIKRHQNVRIAEMQKLTSRVDATKRLFDAKKGLQLNELEKLFKEGKITEKQGFKIAGRLETQAKVKTFKSEAKTLQAIKDRRKAANILANKDIKSFYEKSKVPLHLREYLPLD